MGLIFFWLTVKVSEVGHWSNQKLSKRWVGVEEESPLEVLGHVLAVVHLVEPVEMSGSWSKRLHYSLGCYTNGWPGCWFVSWFRWRLSAKKESYEPFLRAQTCHLGCRGPSIGLCVLSLVCWGLGSILFNSHPKTVITTYFQSCIVSTFR